MQCCSLLVHKKCACIAAFEQAVLLEIKVDQMWIMHEPPFEEALT